MKSLIASGSFIGPKGGGPRSREKGRDPNKRKTTKKKEKGGGGGGIPTLDLTHVALVAAAARQTKRPEATGSLRGSQHGQLKKKKKKKESPPRAS